MTEPNIQGAFELAIQHHQAGRFQEAQRLYRQVLAHRPDHSGALHYSGVVANQLGQKYLAVELIRQAIAIRPDYAEAHSNLGNALKDIGKFDEAIAACGAAIALKPGLPEAHNNLGSVLNERGQLDEAVAAYRQAIALRSDYAEAHYNLSNALMALGRLDEAADACRRAIAARPTYAEAHGVLGYVLKDQGRLGESIAAFRRAVLLKPGYVEAHSSLLYTILFDPSYDARSIADELRGWNQQRARPLRKFIRPHLNDPSPERRLRIGCVSSDFCDHACAFFIDPLLHYHDHRGFEIFCYAQMVRSDEITRRMQGYADHWHDTRPWSDERLAEQIREDGIDILVDMKLHTASNRLLALARKPAPIQVSWVGYPGSSGLETIDYRITDRYLEPIGGDNAYADRPIYSPSCFWCYDPMSSEPSPGPLPAASAGHITFGSLNSFSKITEPALRLWAGAMRAVAGSRLLVLAPRGSARDDFLRKIGDLGVDAGRVEFVDRRPRAEYLKTYDRIDIGLDTLPYNGHTTSLDALWMGVPLVTLPGETPVGRAGRTFLSNLGLPELIASTPEEFVRIAADLAGDLNRLDSLRRGLRARMQGSPLMDGEKFARDMEAAYRRMWRAWCEQAAAKS
ncbi:MAG: tetratricopeptide repeat protein [Tepidisphaeraceae bacterium]